MKRLAASLLLAVLLLGTLVGIVAPSFAATGSDALEVVSEHRILVLIRLPLEHYRPSADYGGNYGDDAAQGARLRLARRIAHDHRLTLAGNWAMPLIGLDCFIMDVPASESPEEAAAQVSRDPGVRFAEPMHVFHVQASAGGYEDPLFNAQPAAREWHLADLHRLAVGRGVRIAVIDSGIEANHPDLIGQVAVLQDFAPYHAAGGETHGTGVAGIIAAKAGNGVGIVGIAPGARLMGLRACWQVAATVSLKTATVCDSLSLAKALHYAVEHGAQIINMSLSGADDVLLAQLIDAGRARGVAIVAAYDTSQPDGGFPASHPGVFAVADEFVAVLPPNVYTAPGEGIPTTQPGGRWFLVNGSSFAAAHVSGLLALLRERRGPHATLTLVSAHDGGGAIASCATLLKGLPPCSCGCDAHNQLSANLRP